MRRSLQRIRCLRCVLPGWELPERDADGALAAVDGDDRFSDPYAGSCCWAARDDLGYYDAGCPCSLADAHTLRAQAEEATEATVIGYTVQAFRERLGPAGVRDLIEHRELAPVNNLGS